MRNIKMLVGSKPIGTALTWAYPKAQGLGIFTIPTYSLTVSGRLDNSKTSQRTFEVLRFGIQGKTATSAKVVGLAEQQSHIIKAWLLHYTTQCIVLALWKKVPGRSMIIS